MNAQVVKANLHQSPFTTVVRAALIATTIVSLFVLAFTWPTKAYDPKDLPVSVSGPSEMVDQLKTNVDEKSDGAITFIDASNRDDAVQQIKERKSYGAIVLSKDGAPEVLTAPAANTAASNMLSGLAQQITVQTQTKIAEAQTSGLKQGIEKGTAGVKALQEQVDGAQKAADAGDAKVKEAQASLENLRPQLAESKAQATVAEQQIDSLSEAADGKGEAADLARAQTETLQRTADDAKKRTEDLQTRITNAEGVVSSGGGPEAQAARGALEKLNPKLAEAKGKVAQAQGQLESLGKQQEQHKATTATVTNVVDLSENDSTGAGLSVASFPLVLAGMIGGIMMLTLVQGLWSRLAASFIYSVLSGLMITLILHTWFGFVQGNFALLWLAFVVSGLATSLFIIGAGSLLGFGPGMAIGAITTMLLGNPLSGASSPWEFLPKPWGAMGQHMVPGASARLLRSISYFPDANTAPQWITLLVWCAVGLALAFAGYAIAKKNKHKAEPMVVEV